MYKMVYKVVILQEIKHLFDHIVFGDQSFSHTWSKCLGISLTSAVCFVGKGTAKILYRIAA